MNTLLLVIGSFFCMLLSGINTYILWEDEFLAELFYGFFATLGSILSLCMLFIGKPDLPLRLALIAASLIMMITFSVAFEPFDFVDFGVLEKFLLPLNSVLALLSMLMMTYAHRQSTIQTFTE